MDAIDKARKSLVSTEDTVEKSAEVEKTDPDVKAQEEATKSTEEAEKNVNQATISDDNEKVIKDVDGDDDDVEESADKKCKTAKSADDDQEPDTDDEAKDDKEDKAKKSVEDPADNADEAEKSVEEPAEEDKAEKSIPTGKAVATGSEDAKDDTIDKSVEAPQEDGVTKEALENVIAKSLLGFDGVQSGVNLERKHALKSLLADTRELKGTTVPDSFIERYNEI